MATKRDKQKERGTTQKGTPSLNENPTNQQSQLRTLGLHLYAIWSLFFSE